jgi:AcrR family transcriptional regulator
MTTNQTLSRRERNLAEIRERATGVAACIVLGEGVGALSARRLARDLNISVGSLYNAFGDLNAVVRAVIGQCAAMLSDVLHAAVDTSGPDSLARVLALGNAYFDFAIAEPQRWSLLFEYRTDIQDDPKAWEYQSGLLGMLIRAGGGDPASETHRQFFLLLWASVHGLVSLACRPTIVAVDPELARTYIRDLVVSGLASLPPR